MTFPKKAEGGLLLKRAEDGGGHALQGFWLQPSVAVRWWGRWGWAKWHCLNR